MGTDKLFEGDVVAVETYNCTCIIVSIVLVVQLDVKIDVNRNYKILIVDYRKIMIFQKLK